MTPFERKVWYSLVSSRAMLSLLDLAGILTIGLLVTSSTLFLAQGSDSERVITFGGFKVPAITSESLSLVIVAVLFMFLGKAVLSVYLTKKSAFFVARIEARASKVIAEKSFGGDLAVARRRSREEMMFAISSGSPSAFNTFLNSANTFITEATLFTVICLGFFLVDPIATLGAIAYFGLVVFVMQFFVGALLGRAAERNLAASVQANTAVSDLLSVFRELLVSKRTENYIEGIFRARTSAAASSAQMYYLSGMPRYIVEAALLVGIALFMFSQSLTGDLVKSAGTIGVFLSGGFRLTAALLPLQNSLLSMKQVVAPAKTAHDILFSQNSRYATPKAPEIDVKNLPIVEEGASINPIGVSFDNVSFSYENSSISTIDSISFEIKPGSQVALVGESGAGKSTIADLICRVLNPTSGSIQFFQNLLEHRVNELPPVSYVPQRPGLVSGTILDNVALGVEPSKICRTDALEALRLANLEAFIGGLREGVDTQIGKLKDSLSGGQMQRLGLARALYSKPGLLVLDEATSALDAATESEIQNALEAMRGKVTVVLIAHRLNTIQHADAVFLIHDGKLRDSGKFNELVSRNPDMQKVVALMKVSNNQFE